MDDQAETVLFHLFRGAGLRGMAGMEAKKGDIIRPFLCLRKSEITDWLKQEGQEWVTDSTNLEQDAVRNRIRNDFLPAAETLMGFGVVEHIAAAAGDFLEADRWFQRRAGELLDRNKECPDREAKWLDQDRKWPDRELELPDRKKELPDQDRKWPDRERE